MFQSQLVNLKSFVMMNLIYVFHVLIVGPLLVKVGMNCNCKGNRNLTNMLVFLGLGVMAYHTYQMYMRFPSKVMELAIVLVVGLGLVLNLGKML
jgi:hypothetical protein